MRTLAKSLYRLKYWNWCMLAARHSLTITWGLSFHFWLTLQVDLSHPMCTCCHIIIFVKGLFDYYVTYLTDTPLLNVNRQLFLDGGLVPVESKSTDFQWMNASSRSSIFHHLKSTEYVLHCVWCSCFFGIIGVVIDPFHYLQVSPSKSNDFSLNSGLSCQDEFRHLSFENPYLK